MNIIKNLNIIIVIDELSCTCYCQQIPSRIYVDNDSADQNIFMSSTTAKHAHQQYGFLHLFLK